MAGHQGRPLGFVQQHRPISPHGGSASDAQPHAVPLNPRMDPSTLLAPTMAQAAGNGSHRLPAQHAEQCIRQRRDGRWKTTWRDPVTREKTTLGSFATYAEACMTYHNHAAQHMHWQWSSMTNSYQPHRGPGPIQVQRRHDWDPMAMADGAAPPAPEARQRPVEEPPNRAPSTPRSKRSEETRQATAQLTDAALGAWPPAPLPSGQSQDAWQEHGPHGPPPAAPLIRHKSLVQYGQYGQLSGGSPRSSSRHPADFTWQESSGVVTTLHADASGSSQPSAAAQGAPRYSLPRVASAPAVAVAAATQPLRDAQQSKRPKQHKGGQQQQLQQQQQRQQPACSGSSSSSAECSRQHSCCSLPGSPARQRPGQASDQCRQRSPSSDPREHVHLVRLAAASAESQVSALQAQLAAAEANAAKEQLQLQQQLAEARTQARRQQRRLHQALTTAESLAAAAAHTQPPAAPRAPAAARLGSSAARDAVAAARQPSDAADVPEAPEAPSLPSGRSSKGRPAAGMPGVSPGASLHKRLASRNPDPAHLALDNSDPTAPTRHRSWSMTLPADTAMPDYPVAGPPGLGDPRFSAVASRRIQAAHARQPVPHPAAQHNPTVQPIGASAGGLPAARTPAWQGPEAEASQAAAEQGSSRERQQHAPQFEPYAHRRFSAPIAAAMGYVPPGDYPLPDARWQGQAPVYAPHPSVALPPEAGGYAWWDSMKPVKRRKQRSQSGGQAEQGNAGMPDAVAGGGGAEPAEAYAMQSAGGQQYPRRPSSRNDASCPAGAPPAPAPMGQDLPPQHTYKPVHPPAAAGHTPPSAAMCVYACDAQAAATAVGTPELDDHALHRLASSSLIMEHGSAHVEHGSAHAALHSSGTSATAHAATGGAWDAAPVQGGSALDDLGPLFRSFLKDTAAQGQRAHYPTQPQGDPGACNGAGLHALGQPGAAGADDSQHALAGMHAQAAEAAVDPVGGDGAGLCAIEDGGDMLDQLMMDDDFSWLCC